MLSIRYTKKSKEDIDSIFDFIASDNPLYADEVIERIRHSIAYLESFPYLGTLITRNIRKIVEPRYRFTIVYSISGENIDILGVYKYKENWK